MQYKNSSCGTQAQVLGMTVAEGRAGLYTGASTGGDPRTKKSLAGASRSIYWTEMVLRGEIGVEEEQPPKEG